MLIQIQFTCDGKMQPGYLGEENKLYHLLVYAFSLSAICLR